MKMDRQELTFGKFDWDDKIPDELRPLWESHFQMMKDFGNLKFKRATIPDNAINLDIQTLDFGEQANQWYVRVYMPDFRGNMDLFRVSWFYPEPELYQEACDYQELNRGEVVRRSFKNLHKEAFNFTDSQISLFWITNDQKPLKQWVRNRAIEIQRFTKINQ